jgi:hypothetical protein
MTMKGKVLPDEAIGQKCHKNHELVRSDLQLTCRIADELDMKILVQDLGMRNLAAKLLP